MQVVDCLLARLYIPNAVAGEQDKLTVRLDGQTLDVGVSSHTLVLWLQQIVVFVLKVAQGS